MNTVKENLNAFNDLGTQGYEAARQLGEINLRTMEKLVSRQMDVMTLIMETSLRQASMVSEAKGYNELVKGQVDMAKEMAERLMNESRENIQFATDAREEYRAWFEQGVEKISENMSKAQEVA